MDVLETLDSLQNAAEKDSDKKKSQNKKPEYHFDKLKMYFGEDYELNGITISIPTIGDILEIGESRFYHALSPFLNNPTSVRVFLYDVFKKDWNKTKEIEVFFILYKMLKLNNEKALESNPDAFDLLDIYDLIFKKKSLRNLELKTDNEGNFILADPIQKLIIREDEYLEIAEFIRSMLDIHPKTEKAKGKTTKHWMLQEDRMKAQQNEDKKSSSTLLPLVSACVNHPGFKYKLEELKQVNICQFMDSVQRIQKYEQGVAAISGIYSGMVSSKDIPKDLINFMGDL